MNFAPALRLAPDSVVTLTGAGGKTTAMVRLGQELAVQGIRVLATTTTRLGLDQLRLFPAFLVNPRPQDVAVMLAKWRFLLVVRGIDRQQDKALGYPPERIAGFRSLADVVLVEGDGSRGLPVKAPAPHEPVVPDSTSHLVNVVNLAALGQTVGPETVHHPTCFAELTGTRPDDRITLAVLARLLLHPDGPARGAPVGAERYFLLNGASSAPDRGRVPPQPSNLQPSTSYDAAERLAVRLAGAPHTTAALLAEVAQEPPVLASVGKVAAVVLAAGASSRFGSPKQLLDWQGQPLLRHVVLQTLAAPVQQIVVVVGAHFEEVTMTLQGLPVTMVYNPDWEQGQSTSMQAGLRACAPETQAVLFVLGDQPALPPELTQRLVAAHRQTLAPIVAPRHRGHRGNPVLFDRTCFAELLAVTGDSGGRSLFTKHADQVVWIETGPETLDDIDRPEDVAGGPGASRTREQLLSGS